MVQFDDRKWTEAEFQRICHGTSSRLGRLTDDLRKIVDMSSQHDYLFLTQGMINMLAATMDAIEEIEELCARGMLGVNVVISKKKLDRMKWLKEHSLEHVSHRERRLERDRMR
jgi:hypothetical protein